MGSFRAHRTFARFARRPVAVCVARATTVPAPHPCYAPSQVLLELKEYASEVDVDFVRKAVRTIGRCAIKLEVAAERCIKVRRA